MNRNIQNASPMFSIVIPVYNRPLKAIDAIDSCLSQSYDDWEVIIVDDGSNTPFVLTAKHNSDGRISIIKNKTNQGASYARNVGIKAARGKYIAFLDSDDLFLPEKLEICAKEIESINYSSQYYLCSRILLKRGENSQLAIPERLLRKNECILSFIFNSGGFVSTCTLVVPARIAKSTLFREDLTVHEDYDFVWRLQQQGVKAIMLEHALAIWMDIHKENRLSHSENIYNNSKKWVDIISTEIPRPLSAAIKVRLLAPIAARSKYIVGLKIYFTNVYFAKELPFISKSVCFIKCLAPGFYRHITSWYVYLSGRIATENTKNE